MLTAIVLLALIYGRVVTVCGVESNTLFLQRKKYISPGCV
jgi:hypothetical protein